MEPKGANVFRLLLLLTLTIVKVIAQTEFTEFFTDDDYMTTDFPDFTTNWGGPSCPTEIWIWQPNQYLHIGDVLTCRVENADDFPTIVYTWTNVQSGETTVGQTVTVTKPGLNTYRCEAFLESEDGMVNCSLATESDFDVIAITCMHMKQANARTPSGIYTINLRNGKSFQVYCEMGLNGGGYTFLSPQSMVDLTDGDVQEMFTDRSNFLLKLRLFDGRQPFVVLSQISHFSDVPLMLGLSQHNGYRETANEPVFRLSTPYLYFGFLPDVITLNTTVTQWGLNTNGNERIYPKFPGGKNYFALFPGFQEGVHWDSGTMSYTLCQQIFQSSAMPTPSGRLLPEDYFMALEVQWQQYCLASSNSENLNNLGVSNAAIGFR